MLSLFTAFSAIEFCQRCRQQHILLPLAQVAWQHDEVLGVDTVSSQRAPRNRKLYKVAIVSTREINLGLQSARGAR